ncbi:Crp/Fnr family transcriptional regulator [Chloroflexus aggregans]|uniref:Transcriptional regulator, Crp/Fnr family n=1 Tax=Chloroflexus aggregans (strain MD-66 / DSM 9485) TaxID=326427 RepID=B8G4R0_CHLAD|nr:Crp/Fnr family transcriptional regulator [Chloroflexus aggregans]ACL25536.1 transcriptional regulator, Crp/Fnr family [Chloroflexus aggregans DSM 9485]
MMQPFLSVPLFAGLDESTVAVILAAGRPLRVRRGRSLFTEQTPATWVYLVKDGWFRLYKLAANGRQSVVRLAIPPEIIGISALFPDAIYTLSAQAITSSLVLRWSATVMQTFAQTYPQLRQNSLQILTKLREDLQQQVLELATEPVEQRLAHTLRRLADQYHCVPQADGWITIPIMQRDLADLIGASHYTVNRLLHQWQQQGLVVFPSAHLLMVDLVAITARFDA